jgi:DNA-binding MarR family transcriptional regulator
MKTDLFLDLETLALGPDSVILEIGAIRFDLDTRSGEHEIIAGLEHHLEIDQQQIDGRSIDPETILWHQRKGHDIHAGSASLPYVLDQLAEFAATARNVWIWGADFDSPILSHAYAQHQRTPPWRYHQIKDARTVWTLAFGETIRPPRDHRGLADCEAAIADLAFALRHLGSRGPDWHTLETLRRAGLRTLTDAQAIQLLAAAPMAHSALARSLDLTTAALTGMKDRLEARGIATSTTDPDDRRSHLLTLTPAGHRLAAALGTGTPTAA